MNEMTDTEPVRFIADPTRLLQSRMDVSAMATHPFSTFVSGEGSLDAALGQLGPNGRVVAERLYRGTGGVDRLLEGDEWMALVECHVPPTVRVHISATSRARRDAVAEHFGQAFPKPQAERLSLPITFTYDANPTSRKQLHRVRAAPWADISRNYPSQARPSITELVQTHRPSAGRLVLFHGPPGTGKSHLLRTLAWEWRSWADAVVVTDPERLLSRTAYLYEVLDHHPGGDRWMFLIMEDAAELLGETPTSRMHPGLAKLLNLSDGMMGEALGLVVAITTNEPLNRIHPAIMRPGRCLANLHFDAFRREEAALRAGAVVLPQGDHFTLSEIYEVERKDKQIVEAGRPDSHGV